MIYQKALKAAQKDSSSFSKKQTDSDLVYKTNITMSGG